MIWAIWILSFLLFFTVCALVVWMDMAGATSGEVWTTILFIVGFPIWGIIKSIYEIKRRIKLYKIRKQHNEEDE